MNTMIKIQKWINIIFSMDICSNFVAIIINVAKFILLSTLTTLYHSGYPINLKHCSITCPLILQGSQNLSFFSFFQSLLLYETFYSAWCLYILCAGIALLSVVNYILPAPTSFFFSICWAIEKARFILGRGSMERILVIVVSNPLSSRSKNWISLSWSASRSCNEITSART